MPLTPEEQNEFDALNVEFGGLTPEEIIEMQTLEKSFEEQGFFENVGQDIRKREAQATESRQRMDSGEIGFPEHVYQMSGQVAGGAVADVVGRGMQEIGGAIAEADRFLGGHGAGAAKSIIESLPTFDGRPMTETVPEEMARIAGSYGEWAKDSPRAAANIEAGVNLTAVGVPLVKKGEDIIEAGIDLGKTLSRKNLARVSAKELRETGGELFKKAELEGGMLKPKFWDDYMSRIQKKITKRTKLGENLQQATGSHENIKSAIQALKTAKNDPLSLSVIKEADEILGDLAESSVNQMGRYDRAGKDFLTMQMTLREMVDNADEAMFEGGKKGFETVKQARKVWAASNRMDDVERIISKAEGANQPSTVLRNGFRRLRDNPKKMKRFTPEEQFAIKKAAKDGSLQSFLKLGGSGLGPVIAGSTGFVAGGPVAGGGAALGALAVRQSSKNMAEAIANAKAKNVLSAVQATAQNAPTPYVSPHLSTLAIDSIEATAPAGFIGMAGNESLAQRAQRLFEVKQLPNYTENE